MNLPYEWTMPKDVEELLGRLNEQGGTCYHEHAVLIRAFFDKCMGLPPSDGLEWQLVQVPSSGEAERDSEPGQGERIDATQPSDVQAMPGESRRQDAGYPPVPSRGTKTPMTDEVVNAVIPEHFISQSLINLARQLDRELTYAVSKSHEEIAADRAMTVALSSTSQWPEPNPLAKKDGWKIEPAFLVQAQEAAREWQDQDVGYITLEDVQAVLLSIDLPNLPRSSTANVDPNEALMDCRRAQLCLLGRFPTTDEALAEKGKLIGEGYRVRTFKLDDGCIRIFRWKA